MSAPQPVFPWPPTDEAKQLLINARAELGADVLFVEAHYGSPGRTVCFGDTPPWLAPLAPIQSTNVSKQGSVTAALSYALSGAQGQFEEEFLLSKWMNCDVRQVGVEEYAGGVKFV